jgi:hypothetical protein
MRGRTTTVGRNCVAADKLTGATDIEGLTVYLIDTEGRPARALTRIAVRPRMRTPPQTYSAGRWVFTPRAHARIIAQCNPLCVTACRAVASRRDGAGARGLTDHPRCRRAAILPRAQRRATRLESRLRAAVTADGGTQGKGAGQWARPSGVRESWWAWTAR